MKRHRVANGCSNINDEANRRDWVGGQFCWNINPLKLCKKPKKFPSRALLSRGKAEGARWESTSRNQEEQLDTHQNEAIIPSCSSAQPGHCGCPQRIPESNMEPGPKVTGIDSFMLEHPRRHLWASLLEPMGVLHI